jgi:hypothetical protein
VITEYIVAEPPSDTYYDPSYGRSYDSAGAEAAFTSAVIDGWGKQVEGVVRYRPGPAGETVRFDPAAWPAE